MFAIADFSRNATVAIGALVLSTAALGLATAPARASTTPLASWQSSVNHSIDRNVHTPAGAPDDELQSVTLAVSFDADGKYAGAAVKRSSGSDTVDAEALRTAKSVRYPVLPTAAGIASTVEMQLFFGEGADLASAQVRRQQLASR